MKPFHELANILPLLEGEEFAALVADIRERGLLEPIMLLDGAVLDGRNRERACEAASVEPGYVEYGGEHGSALQYVIAKNILRRQLEVGQKALAVQKFRPYVEAQAREQQRGGQGGLLLPISVKAKSAHTAAVLATEAGVARSTMQQAIALDRAAQESPQAADLRDKVQAGKMKLNTAHRHLRLLKRQEDAPAPELTPGEEADADAAEDRANADEAAGIIVGPADDDIFQRDMRQLRAIRLVLATISGLRREMRLQHVPNVTKGGMEAWWNEIEQEEWDGALSDLQWYESMCGTEGANLSYFIRGKARLHRGGDQPPRVKRRLRAEAKEAKQHGEATRSKRRGA